MTSSPIPPAESATWRTALRAMGACDDAVKWSDSQPDWPALWQNCQRGDWMLWYLARTPAGQERWSDDWRQFILATCDCARLSLHLVPDGETRPVEALDTVEAAMLYGDESCDVDVRDAYAYAYAAYAAAAADADAAAAAAAYAATTAADAADAAYAAYAADAAAFRAARGRVLADCAEIVRRYFPTVTEPGAWT